MDETLTTALLLAGIAIAEGFRRVPAGAIVAKRMGFAGWQVQSTTEEDGRVQLVSWCVPIVFPLVLSPLAERDRALRRNVTRFRARQRRVRNHIVALRVLGAAILGVLVVVLPLSIARHGTWGFMLSLLALLGMGIAQSVIAAAALRRAGVARGKAVFSSIRFVWPFSAPLAAEVVLQSTVGDLPAFIVLHELLTEEEFVRATRPALYDAVERNGDDSDDGKAAAIIQLLGRERVVSLLARTAAEDGELWCPRCGTTYIGGRDVCADCAGVPLLGRHAVRSA